MAKHNTPFDLGTCLLVLHVPSGLRSSTLIDELRPAFVLEDVVYGKFFVTLASMLEVSGSDKKLIALMNAGSTYKMAEPGYYLVGGTGLLIHNDCSYEIGTLTFTPSPD